VVLVLLLELFDHLRAAWEALVDAFDRQRPMPVADPSPRPRRRAF